MLSLRHVYFLICKIWQLLAFRCSSIDQIRKLLCVFKCEKIVSFILCPFHQGMKLNIIRFINGFNAHIYRSLFWRLTGGDIYVTTFVPKPIKYHILRIPLRFSLFFHNDVDAGNGKMLITTFKKKNV